RPGLVTPDQLCADRGSNRSIETGGRAMPRTTIPFSRTETAHGALVVSSLEEALDFWVGILGFRIVSQSPVGVERAEGSSAVVEAFGQVIELVEGRIPLDRPRKRSREAGMLHLSFSAGHLEAILRHIEYSRWRIVGVMQRARGDRTGGLFTYL